MMLLIKFDVGVERHVHPCSYVRFIRDDVYEWKPRVN